MAFKRGKDFAADGAVFKMSGFGLEEIGIPGRDYLKEALTSCTDPLKAIEDFQVIALCTSTYM